MTVYSDSAGNYYLGDCKFSNSSIYYPTVKVLTAHPYSSLVEGLNSIASLSGLKIGSLKTQENFNTSGGINYQSPFLTFSSKDDIITNRYNFSASIMIGSGPPSSQASINNDSGNSLVSTNKASSGAYFSFNIDPTNVNFSKIAVVAVTDGYSLGLVICQKDLAGKSQRFDFYYAGVLKEVNTGFNYYNSSIITSSIAMGIYLTSGRDTSVNQNYPNNSLDVIHYMLGGKRALNTDDAQYPIACADNQIPTTEWATDFLIFDNNSVLGNPCIGKARNLLLSTATNLTIGKPVYITGSAVPDGGSRWYLPVGNFAGKTVLMKCYSSLEVPS